MDGDPIGLSTVQKQNKKAVPVLRSLQSKYKTKDNRWGSIRKTETMLASLIGRGLSTPRSTCCQLFCRHQGKGEL